MANIKHSGFFLCRFTLIILFIVGFAAIEGLGQMENFGTSIDPDKYIVGPGDKFQIDFVSETSEKVELTVTPEGYILLDAVGQIMVGGLNLSEARDRIDLVMESYFAKSEYSISLMGVKSMQILVTGAVVKPGLYDAFVSKRVSEVIDKAGGLLPGASRRNIELRADDRITEVDLIKFQRSGDLEANPYIYSGFHIHIPTVIDSSAFMIISGEVVSPGRYEYKPGDNLSTAIELAYGFTGLQNDEIEIYRRGQQSPLKFSTDDLDYILIAGDKINVGRRKVSFEEDYVIVVGELNRPGVYPLDKIVSCKDALALAGGATALADLYSLSLIRKNATGKSIEVELGMDTHTQVYPAAINRSLFPNDFHKINVYPGDSIYVPSLTGMITIYGQVQNPGQIEYTKPLTISAAVALVGGLAPMADKNGVTITRKTSGLMTSVGLSEMAYDGDIIKIGEAEEKKSSWDKIKDAALILGGLGLTYLAIDNLTE